jgi:hypothetical protein
LLLKILHFCLLNPHYCFLNHAEFPCLLAKSC